MIPLGKNMTTAIKSPPRKNGQSSGKWLVNVLRMKLTPAAPMMAPESVPRPPTATQITISIEGRTPIWLGVIIPTCGT